MWHRRATQPERKQQKICISDNIYSRHVKDIYIYMCMYFIYSTAIASWRAGNQKLVPKRQQQRTKNWPKQWTTKRQSTWPIKAINQQKAKRKGKREEIAGQPP